MARSICNKRNAINYSHASTRSIEAWVQSVTDRANFIYRSYRCRRCSPLPPRQTENEMRLQVTERIVLIYSNVSAVRVGEYRYRICRECNGATLQRMRHGGVISGGKRGSGGDGGSDDGVVVVVTYKQ